MTFDEACRKAIKRFLDSKLDYGIDVSGETKEDWYFMGGFADSKIVNYSAFVLKINKTTGNQTDMGLGLENDKELKRVKELDIPEEYRLKYKR
jgi:hypothetical protein